ncbi:MAG: hypothetical protein MHM6MM_000289 [Cercozoa sp. M6MM]
MKLAATVLLSISAFASAVAAERCDNKALGEKIKLFGEVSLKGTDGTNGPESFAHDSAGVTYFSNGDGSVRKVTDDASGANEVYFQSQPDLTPEERATCGTSVLNEFTCGRPLGILFDSQDNLYVADAYRGILRAPRSDPSQVEVLASKYADDSPIKFANSMLLDEEANVLYFTTSSDQYYRLQFVSVVVDNTPDGKLIKLDLNTGELEVLVDDLAFANGIQYWSGRDGNGTRKDPAGIIINETNARRLRRYYLTGERAGQNDVFVQDIGGYADNLKSWGNDKYLVGLFTETQDWVTAIQEHEEIQEFMLQQDPLSVISKFDSLGLVKVVSATGRVLETWIDLTGANFGQVAEAEVVGDELYLGSVVRPHYGVMKLDDLIDVDAAYIGCEN